MTIVNPPPIKIPESIRRDVSEEGFSFLEELVFMIFQLWKRTGAGEDIVERSHVFSTGNEGLNAAAIGELEKRLNNIQDGDDFSMLARISEIEKCLQSLKQDDHVLLHAKIDEITKSNVIDFPVNLLANVDKLQKDVQHLNRQAQIPGSFMAAKIDKLFKDLHNLENSTQPTLLMGFIDSLTKTNSQQDSQIADLISTNALMSAYISNILKGIPVNYVEVDDTYTASKFDQGIYCDTTANGDFTVTIPDPSLAFWPVTVFNCTGSASTVTVATAVGSIIDTATLSDEQSRTFNPRGGASEWRQS